jgi:hypothetical protein
VVANRLGVCEEKLLAAQHSIIDIALESEKIKAGVK